MANRVQLQTALQKPYDRILFGKEVLSPVFGSCFNLSSSAVPAPVQPNPSEQSVIQSVFIYGTIHLEDGTEITCYEVNLQASVRIEHSKVAIQRYVRKLLTAGQMALVNFIAPQNKKVWRLTLVAKDSEWTEQGIKEKTTHAKRYTYLLGPSETCKTAAERFESLSTEKQITFQALVNAFSVEKLSNAFFDEYTLHYQKFCDYLQESNFRKSVFNITIPTNATKEEKDKACKPIRDFVKKLLGRIVFLYFVQKKGWLGASDTQYKDGLTDFIKQLFKQSGGNDAFYCTWLTKLFFETLNKERNNDDFIMPNGKKVKVPFLNDGLFDKEKYDEATLTIPATLFHHRDLEEIPLTERNKNHARGFLDFLDAFNFTVHEDSPDDHTVAVDPEMLGHIFENLLEDNKDKGAFYTPKEIVHYMCQESLTEYLTTHLSKEYTVYKEIGNAQVELFGNESKTGQLKMVEQLGDKALNRDDVAYIVKHKDISHLTKAQLKKIDTLLDTVKICDPAIGSGAFPMGLLQEIHAIKEVIAYELQLPWKPADVKENIIQNSVYGVDIEKGAVDIARLRFWLSLVVDEEKPRALPNLDYKIVVGDSLVSKFEGEIIEIDWEIKEGTQANIFGNENVLKRQALLKKITAKQQEYFHATDKQKLAEEIRNLKIEILINQLELMINTKGLEKKPTESGKKAAAQMELWLQTQGWKNAMAKLQKLKQNKEAPFEHFDWKLDFPEVLNPYLVNGNAGFDIVIGNPPYVESKKLKHISQFLKKYRVYSGTADLSSYFFEVGISLSKENGLLCLINTNKFFNTGYGKPVRELIIENEIKQLINFEQVEVFEGILVSSVIISIKKKKFLQDNQFPYKKFFKLKNSEFVKTFIEEIENRESYLQKHLTDKEWSFADDSNLVLKTKIELDSILLKNIKGVNVFRGVTTGYNPAFIIDSEQKKELINQDRKNINIIKPLLQGRNIRKWIYNSSNEFLLQTGYEIAINKDYPVIFEHLKSFKKELEVRTDQGVNWWNLRACKYYSEFEKEKIIWGLTADKWAYAFDDKGHYLPSNGYILTSEKIPVKYLLAIINSNLLKYYFGFIGVMTAGGAFTLKHATILELPIKLDTNQSSYIQFTDYIIFLKSHPIDNVSDKLMPTYFEQIIDGMVYELYFPELIKKHKREIIQHLGELPEFTDKMSNEQKMKICKTVFERLHHPSHPVRIHLEKMKEEIPEIRIIEGIEK
jgi:hypothetical protein